MHLSSAMARLGHLAARRQLAELRIGRHQVDRALNEGKLLAVRAGWVATPQANQLAIIAVLRGARLTGATALRSYDVWAGDDRRVHLQVPANAHRVNQHPSTPIAQFSLPMFIPSGVVTHWARPIEAVLPTSAATAVPRRSAPSAAAAWRVSVAEAIVQFARHEPHEQIAAVLESAVHKKRLSRSAVALLLTHLPRHQRRAMARLNFLGESGMETIVRFRLEQLGLRLQQQVQIGEHRVDIVIDGWLIVELDGDEWHDPVKDRIRTNRLIRAGYRVLRFGYAEVFGSWDETIATILEMVNGVTFA
ncbi:endonuclease domain-containing protein [Parafrigoribacterium soli]|uniref:endonuclease domain-containing protein n=1 Tax=Parafrigoribacterium soli TaxID=3144663 RepID=UPI0032EE1003